nr:hypothetical protein [Tanacetum cinerariifolium]
MALLPFVLRILLVMDSNHYGEDKKDVEDPENENNEVLCIEEPRVNLDKDANVNNTNNINTVSLTANAASTKDNVVNENIVYGLRDLHTTNVEQLYAYLGQHEYDANEVRLMRERTLDPLALVTNHQMTKSPYQTHQKSYQHTQFQSQVSSFQSSQYGSPYHSSQYTSQAQSSTPLSITYPSNDFQSFIHHSVYNPSSSIPQVEYASSVHQQYDFSQPDTGLVVPVFQKGDDPIDSINHMIPLPHGILQQITS